MIKVLVFKQSNYPVSTKKLKEAVKKTLKDEGVVSDFEVSVAVVGDKKMRLMVDKYYKKNDKPKSYSHPVLSFPSEAVKQFEYPPNKPAPLGEIVISYPAVIEQTKKTGKLIDSIAVDLVKHGTLHLIGVHH